MSPRLAKTLCTLWLGAEGEVAEVPEGARQELVLGGPGTNYRGGMWVVQLLSVAYTEKLPTVWLALGKSQEQPRSEVKGTSEVQGREGTRICSYSEWWQSHTTSQDKKTIPDLSAQEWHRIQVPQSIFLGHAFVLGAHTGMLELEGFPDAVSCPGLGGVVGMAAPETPGCQAWLGLHWFSNCNPFPGKDTALPAWAAWCQEVLLDLPRPH